MNWYKNRLLDLKVLDVAAFTFARQKKGFIKVAYMSKAHDIGFNDMDKKDGYECKIYLTQSKAGVILKVSFISGIYAFPLYTDVWDYPEDEIKRAIKTYNRAVNVVEDLKIEYEDADMPGPTLQGMAREAMRYIDIDRKKKAPSRSLEAAKYEEGETDWRSSIYGNRIPNMYQINNSGGTINFNQQ